MTGYAPAVPFSGVPGWAFLNRTMPEQEAVHAQNSTLQRETAYFRENIGSITRAEQLVDDPVLLKVALGAFGLQDDQANKFFIQKILESAASDDSSLASKMSDKRYAALSKAFAFADREIPRTQLETFPEEIIVSYQRQGFEVAVGEQDVNLRLALSLEREMDQVMESVSTDDGRWYALMGTAPLRSMFETALNLPSSFGSLEIDQQLTIFRDRSEAVFGVSEVSDFSEPEKMEELREMFLLRADASSSGAGSSPALQFLTGSAGSSNILSILYSS